jgi:hypothetical protein
MIGGERFSYLPVPLKPRSGHHGFRDYALTKAGRLRSLILQRVSEFAPSCQSHHVHDCDDKASDRSHTCSDQHQAHRNVHRSVAGVRRPVSVVAKGQQPAQS